ncbi:MAG: type I-C CRISPR-associated endonuclease Cas1c [Mariprofundales bacterium]
MHQVLNTLYIMTQGSYLHLERETLKLDIEKKTRLRIPMHHIGGIVLFGNVMVSPFALHRCAEDGRSVAFFTEFGRFKARLEGSQSGNVLLRRAQHQLLDKPEALDLVRVFLAGKLQNCRSLLLRGAREAKKEEAANNLRNAAQVQANSLRALPTTESLDALRGIEGNAARIYFAALNNMLLANNDAFAFHTRTRRPPRDPINALLSFLYALLTNECVSALESVGLDPQIGYLHALRPGRPSLALDFMESFRPMLADRMALTLINRQQLKPDDFEKRTGGAVQMSENARKTLLTAWQQRKQDTVQHDITQQSVPLALLPLIQARLLARYIRGEDEQYTPYLMR